MTDRLLSLITTISEQIPLPIFAFIASFLDEVLPPVPSHAVFLLLGSLAKAQGASMIELGVIGVIAITAKTIGAVIIYVIADRAEDFVMVRYGKQFGVTHEHIEKIGTHISGSFRDYIALTAIRIIPIIPGSVTSAVCGIVKIPMRVFLVSTIVGSTLMCIFYMFVGNQVTEFIASFL